MAEFLIAFETVILVIHFIVAFFLVSVILLQAGKGTDIGTAFGAGGSQALFGARSAATLLTKLTTAAALTFLLTSLSLATISKYKTLGGKGSIIGDDLEQEQGVVVDEGADEPKSE